MVLSRSTKFMFLLVLPLMLLSLVMAQEAQAALAARGPVNPDNGFPVWYQDTDGTALSLCDDPADPLCLADPVIAGNPLSEAIGFGGEAFWWDTETAITLPADTPVVPSGNALIVMAMEAAFISGDPAAGQQQTFGRMRIRIDVGVAGTYTVTHPFGTSVFEVPQSRIDATGGVRAISDAGIGSDGLVLVSSTVPLGDIGCEVAPCDFNLALASGVGPFLRWDPAVAPAAPAGHLGNPTIPHTITGGVNSVFTVTGPAGAFGATNTVTTDQFAVSGRIFNIVPAAGDYFWTWYDNASPGFKNWVLMGNPAAPTGVGNLSFSTSVAGVPRPVPGQDAVAPGDVLFGMFPGKIGGPVKVTSNTGGRAITSQRTLLNGNSLDEVAGQEFERLSNRFLWTWYDNASPGFTNWVLISNPDPVNTAFFRLTIDGILRATGTIPEGGNVTPNFPGLIGGPVEVEAFTDAGMVTPKNVMASQRVLSNGGMAFNEEPGIPAGLVNEISDHYNWTWYDMVSPEARNWILIANPEDAPSPDIFYDILIAGALVVDNGGPIAAGQDVQLTFPGMIGGPVEVITFTDPGNQAATGADSLASQRVTWGPSFEETYGIDDSDLTSNYHWTWYDNASAGSSNWVLIANPDGAAADIFYQILVDGVVIDSGGPIAEGGNLTPKFPGVIGGPVEVRTTTGAGGTGVAANSIASQRVIWNGHFNEVMGTVLLAPIP